MVNLIFTEIKFEDLEFLNHVRNLFAKDFLHDSREFTQKNTEDWYNKIKPNYWIIKLDNKRIGYFRITSHSIENKNLYIGADLHPDYQGKGLAFTSYMIFLNILFEKYDLNKISLEVLSTNLRAIKLYQKIGFIQEGIKREEIKKSDKYIDSVIMSILKNEWNQISKNKS